MPQDQLPQLRPDLPADDDAFGAHKAIAKAILTLIITNLEGVYNTQRHLLYVACNRARDHLLITAPAPASEFLDDLLDQPTQSTALSPSPNSL